MLNQTAVMVQSTSYCIKTISSTLSQPEQAVIQAEHNCAEVEPGMILLM
jgi:hypothetical protein